MNRYSCHHFPKIVWQHVAGEPEEKAQVEASMQEATDILTAATKGCGSYAKPILRHITTVADFAKREGIQVNAPLCPLHPDAAPLNPLSWSALT